MIYHIKKYLKIATISIGSIALIYSLVWSMVAFYVCDYINKTYSKKDISIPALGKDFSIKFQNARAVGYPFSLGFSLSKFYESSADKTVDYLQPIEFGYDFLKSSFYRKFEGKADIHIFGPNRMSAASEMQGQSNMAIGYSFNFALLKELYKIAKHNPQAHPISLIKNLRFIEFDMRDISIRDVVHNIVFYESPKAYFHIDVSYSKDHKLVDNAELSYLPNEYKGVIDFDIKNPLDKEKGKLVNNMLFGIILPHLSKIQGNFGATADFSELSSIDDLSRAGAVQKVTKKFEVVDLQFNATPLDGDATIIYDIQDKQKRKLILKIALHPNASLKENLINIIKSIPSDKLFMGYKIPHYSLWEKHYSTPEDIILDCSIEGKMLNLHSLKLQFADTKFDLTSQINWGEGIFDLRAPYQGANIQGTIKVENLDQIISTLAEVMFDIMPELKEKHITLLNQDLILDKAALVRSAQQMGKNLSQAQENNSAVIISYKFDDSSGFAISQKDLLAIKQEYMGILLKELARVPHNIKNIAKAFGQSVDDKTIESVLSITK